MRVLTRNKQKAYYQLYEGISDATDSDGNYTGEKVVSYGEKTEFKANIYEGTDPTLYQPYGTEDEAICTLYMSKDLGFDNQTVLWIGDTDKANYIVTSVSNNLNGIVVKAKMLK